MSSKIDFLVSFCYFSGKLIYSRCHFVAKTSYKYFRDTCIYKLSRTISSKRNFSRYLVSLDLMTNHTNICVLSCYKAE